MKEIFYTILITIIFWIALSPISVGKYCADTQNDFLKGYHAELEKINETNRA